MNRRSIRVRLTVWFVAILALGLGGFAVGSRWAVRAGLSQAVDHDLRERLDGVESFMRQELPAQSLAAIRDEFREYSMLAPGGDLFRVCDARGEWLHQSRRLAEGGLPIGLSGEPGAEIFYATVELKGRPVRIATRRLAVNGQSYSVQVAAPLHEFEEGVARFESMLWLGAPLLLALTAAGGYFLSRRALAPVEAIRATAEGISSSNLSERLAVPATGDEIQRLSETLNAMLERLHDALRRMGQFTADASHELRGPTAVIRTTAELAIGGGRSGVSRRHAADPGGGGADDAVDRQSSAAGARRRRAGWAGDGIDGFGCERAGGGAVLRRTGRGAGH